MATRHTKEAHTLVMWLALSSVALVVVVVVRTGVQRRMFIHDDARDVPNYGGRVPVDTTPALHLCAGP